MLLSFSLFSALEAGEIAGPNIPVLISVIDAPIALFSVLAIDDVIKGLANPSEEKVLFSLRVGKWLIEWLEAGNDANKARQGYHGRQ